MLEVKSIKRENIQTLNKADIFTRASSGIPLQAIINVFNVLALVIPVQF